MKSGSLGALIVVAVLVSATYAEASFHFMLIDQVVGGVNGDTSAQAIQLKMRSLGQNLLNGQARMVAYDAAGANPVTVKTFTGTNPASGSCREILIASDNFMTSTSPPAVRDYAMDALIPSSYLAAGSLTFESTGGLVYWRISWGGGGYTGSTTGQVSNDGDGNFGPPFASPLPSSGVDALIYTAACPPGTSSNNAADYSVTASGAVFTNNDGDTFTVTGPSLPATSTAGMAALIALSLGAGVWVLSRRVS